MRPLLLLTVSLTFAGCKVGLETLEYRPSGREQKALSEAARVFAARVERGERQAIADELDLPARKALLIFGASLAYEKHPEIHRAVDLGIAGVVLGLLLLLTGDPEPGGGIIRDSLERTSKAIAEVLKREFGYDVGPGSILDRLAASEHAKDGEVRERLVASLGTTTHTGCHSAGRLVSYDVQLLRYTTWDHADLSRTFVDWKKRARGLHVVEVACTGEPALVVFATEDDHPEPRVVLFRFLSPETFERARARLVGEGRPIE